MKKPNTFYALIINMKKQRCEQCKQKVVYPHDCKCGRMMLCQDCRMFDKHNCTFDWQNERKAQLQSCLVQVVPNKVSKI